MSQIARNKNIHAYTEQVSNKCVEQSICLINVTEVRL